jgi:hypothetical protein
VGLERSPLSLVSTIEELLGRKSSGSGLEIREYGRRDPSRLPRGSLYPQKLALTSPTCRGRSVSIVRSRTQATELSFRDITPCNSLKVNRRFGGKSRLIFHGRRICHAINYRGAGRKLAGFLFSLFFDREDGRHMSL